MPILQIETRLQSSHLRHEYGIFGGKSQTSFSRNATRAGSEKGRLFSQAKRCLKKVLKNAKVTSEELQTVLVEIEATLNSRPLTFVSSGKIEEPLTPYHLLCGRRLLAMPDQEEIEISQLNCKEARGRVALLERLKDHFWIRWRNEYLLELRNLHRLKMKDSGGQTVSVGDFVIIHETKMVCIEDFGSLTE